MTMDKKVTARTRAIQHLNAALDTGVRGEIRKLIEAAIAEGKRADVRPAAITHITLANLRLGDKVADPDNPGLWFRKGRKGAQAIFRYRDPTDSVQREMRIGVHSEVAGEGIGLSDIRTQYRKLRHQVSEGRAPETAPLVSEMTVRAMCDRYIEDYAKPYKRSWQMDAGLLRRFVEAYGDMPAQAVTSIQIGQLMDAVAQGAREKAEKIAESRGIEVKVDAGARQANKVRQSISKCYEFALAKKTKGRMKPGQPVNRIPWLPAGTLNPATDAEQLGYEPLQYQPKLADMRAWVQACANERDMYQAQVMMLQALTFSRVSEVCRMEWAEIDLDAGTWTLPGSKAKNGREHRVALSAAAIDILQSRNTGAGGYVFPSARNASAPVREAIVQGWWTIRRDRAGLDPAMTSHALRRAGLSWVKENGGNLDVRNALSNHKPSGVDEGYSGGANMTGQMREYAQRWAMHLESLIAANVTHIGEASL